jgi:general stress protein YciG
MVTKREKTDTSQRGFASMDAEKQRQIASKGGKIAHERGHAHEFTPEEAREAGRKGGQAVSRDRAHMARIGKLGGEARSEARARRQMPPPAPEAPQVPTPQP